MAGKKRSGRSSAVKSAQKGEAEQSSSLLDMHPEAQLDALLVQARAALTFALQANSLSPLRIFFAFSDGTERARVVHFTGTDLEAVWTQVDTWRAERSGPAVRWLRVDWVTRIWSLSWQQCQQAIGASKRNYFRYGIALDGEFRQAFLEQELNANAMLYLGGETMNAGVNPKNFAHYARQRYDANFQLPEDAQHPVHLFTTRAFLVQPGRAPILLSGFSGGTEGRDTGRRVVRHLDETTVEGLIDHSSRFLAAQVKSEGRFVYGLHPCFDREISTYNSLRHASTTYAMLEAWEVTQDRDLKAAIDRALGHLTRDLIRIYPVGGGQVAYLQDANNEIKLGGNAVCLLALAKYTELTADRRYLPLLEQLAAGIQRMQNPETGQLVHVLNSDDLTVKEVFRIIYYDGEAAFGLMRLYGLTKDARWLQLVEKAFDYFIAQKHWKVHDHWLSYCVNELTLYRPEQRYFEFGIQNVAGHLDFVIERITTFPTLLELMMAAHKMIVRLQHSAEHCHLLKQIDLDKFYRALETRAEHLLNGFFWPEVAMFYKNPQRILGSFFIRHHSFRVRIDDVEHYLSGYVAYLLHYLRQSKIQGRVIPLPPEQDADMNLPLAADAVLVFGGDVNLGRRQHYRSAQLGRDQVLDIPELRSADLSIVNLECVVSTLGEQGVIKGEGGPYYYRARPEMLQILTSAGIGAVAVANNHSGDYGADALLQQRQILGQLGITTAGSGQDREEAFAPAFCQAGDLRVALFSVDSTQHHFAATPDRAGGAYLPLQEAEAWRAGFAGRIAQAKQQAELVMVAVHWGENHAVDPGADEIAIGHLLIDAGADAVLGSSAHRLQGIEVYRDKPIIHDAGDLLFDSIRSGFADGGVFRLGLTKAGIDWVEFIPVGIGFGFSQRLHGEAAQALVQRYSRICERMGTVLHCDAERAYVRLLSMADEAPQPRKAIMRAPEYRLEALQSHAPDPDHGQVQAVPEEARIRPVRINGLTLLGVRLEPREITRRRMLWLETWWTSEVPVTENLRLSYTAVPRTKTVMEEWGRGMEHDPCDWMQPTSRWRPGRIYRDRYGLRPPQMKQLGNAPLQIEIRVLGKQANTECYVHPRLVPVRIPELDQKLSLSYRTQFPESIAEVGPGQTWTAEHLETITGGRWICPPPKGWFVRSVVNGIKHIDLRAAPVLFVAHGNKERAFHEGSTQPVQGKGDRHALLAGNAARLAGAIVSRPVAGLPEGFPQLLVKDPIKAHMELGFAARQRYRGPVIAVTGTVGKSSTIGLLETLFDPGSYLKSVGNYNSRVGVPVQLASLAPDHQAALIEIAQSALWMQRGPITRLIRPTIAVITEIGLSQTNRMVKTSEDVARWKSRIFDGMMPGGIAVIGEHLAHYDSIRAHAARHAGRVLTFGTSADADLRVLRQVNERGTIRLELVLGGEKHELNLPVTNPGMVQNALAVLLVGQALDRDLSEVAARLNRYVPEEGRLVLFDCRIQDRNIQVLDDSWNAEVLSMLNAFRELEQRQGKGRKIAVLGRIVHLGDQAAELHASLAEPLLKTGVDIVLTHGDEMRHLRNQLPEAILGGHFSTASELFAELQTLVKEGDFVLLKGSRRDSDFADISELLRDET